MTRLSKGLIAATAAALLVTLGTIAGAQEKKPTANPKPKSKCNSITEETACKADATCIWIGATTNAKTGKTRKAYCKSRPTPAKKKEPAKT